MSSPLLGSSQHPAIRAAIYVGLTSNDLPDAIIALDIYREAARQEVLVRDPLAETRLGDDEKRVTSAGIFLCAAKLCAPIAPLIFASYNASARDMSYNRPPFDQERRAQELRGMADELLNTVLSPTATSPSRPTQFATVSGTRGY